MEHYVTLFDSGFLPQGVALYTSLERHCQPYTLWVLCVDAEAYRALVRLDLPHVRLLELDKLETRELKQVKAERSRGEYCWTLTPFAPRLVFEADAAVGRVTYLDADLWFLKSPRPIFREFEESGKHVLITEHGYAPEYDQSATSGRFCVQFMTFVRTVSEPVRQWWESRCIEWCYARFEDQKFGDQKYLDDWPERFSEHVHVLRHPEWTLAPWNAVRFPYGGAVFYHFHDVRFVTASRITFGAYSLPPVVVQRVYEPYRSCLGEAVRRLTTVEFQPRPQQQLPGVWGVLRNALASLRDLRWRVDVRHYRNVAS